MSVRRVEAGSEGDEAAAALDQAATDALAGMARHVDGVAMHGIVSAMVLAEDAMRLINVKGLPHAHRRQFETALLHLGIVRATLPPLR